MFSLEVFTQNVFSQNDLGLLFLSQPLLGGQVRGLQHI